jgi:hypothetical protein
MFSKFLRMDHGYKQICAEEKGDGAGDDVFHKKP